MHQSHATRADVEQAAALGGVHVSTYSPGDGVTRYRFSYVEGDYFAVNGLYTALGAREALAFARGAAAGRLA